MKIFVVGTGKLATAIFAANLSFEFSEIVKWQTQHQFLNEKSLIVHAGSGRQLKECLEFCLRTNSAFIELSTGLETEDIEPEFPLIICPNTSILILKTLYVIKTFGSLFENYKISVTESHQSTKKTEPGTAYSFANSLKSPLNEIISIRDQKIQQKKIGIPDEFLDRHAYHKIKIQDGYDEVTIETKVLGHSSYTHGIMTIIETVIKQQLENKKYTVLDLIENKML